MTKDVVAAVRKRTSKDLYAFARILETGGEVQAVAVVREYADFLSEVEAGNIVMLPGASVGYWCPDDRKYSCAAWVPGSDAAGYGATKQSALNALFDNILKGTV